MTRMPSSAIDFRVAAGRLSATFLFFVRARLSTALKGECARDLDSTSGRDGAYRLSECRRFKDTDRDPEIGSIGSIEALDLPCQAIPLLKGKRFGEGQIDGGDSSGAKRISADGAVGSGLCQEGGADDARRQRETRGPARLGVGDANRRTDQTPRSRQAVRQ